MNTVKRVHRIRALGIAITEATSGAGNAFSLLTCDDDPDYDLTSNLSSTTAECQPGARIIALQLHMTIVAVAGRTVEWMLMKDPDGAITAANTTLANLYTADVSTTTAMIRKNTVAVGHILAGDRTAFDKSLNVPGKALRRISLMADGDILRLSFADNGEGAGDSLLYLRGRIITRGP